MTIREQIQKINRKFSELYKRFSRIEEKGRLLERENDAKAEKPDITVLRVARCPDENADERRTMSRRAG